MRLSDFAKSFVPPVAIAAIRWLKMRSSNRDLGRSPNRLIPGSDSYWIYKTQLIKNALADDTLLERFHSRKRLPPKYGVGVDERCIEYPWLISQLDDGHEVLLDAGSTLNHDFILDHVLLRKKQLHIVTLKPEAQCFWQKGISYLFCDLRDIPIRDSYYDVVACISTLEHVGCDNTLYTGGEVRKEDRREDFVVAMRGLARVLKPNGRLFLTVPFGVYQHFGFFQQFDTRLLLRAIEAFGKGKKVVVVFYRYSEQGWNVADEADCIQCEYWSWISRPRNEWPNSLPVEPDLATGARAVACVELVK